MPGSRYHLIHHRPAQPDYDLRTITLQNHTPKAGNTILTIPPSSSSSSSSAAALVPHPTKPTTHAPPPEKTKEPATSHNVQDIKKSRSQSQHLQKKASDSSYATQGHVSVFVFVFIQLYTVHRPSQSQPRLMRKSLSKRPGGGKVGKFN